MMSLMTTCPWNACQASSSPWACARAANIVMSIAAASSQKPIPNQSVSPHHAPPGLTPNVRSKAWAYGTFVKPVDAQ